MNPQDINPGNSTSSALLIIDVQRSLFHKSHPIYQADALLENINRLVDMAHSSGIQVVYIQHNDEKYLVKGTTGWQLHPALQPGDGDLIIHKQHGNAFEETSLGEELARRQICKLFIMGLVTHGCVKATCLGALDLGYKVVLLKDGHSSYSKDAPRLIEEWNDKLHSAGTELQTCAETLLR